jgi:poly(A) polymerase
LNNIQKDFTSVLTSSEIFRKVSDLCKTTHTEVYVVGGYVRDLFLNRPSKDIDFVVIGDGIAFAKKLTQLLGKRADLNVFKNFGTANIRYREYEIEFVGARKESYTPESRNPVVIQGSLDDDLKRRDFTINALAISLNPGDYATLIDQFNGLQDMEAGILRTPLEADKTFSDDPLRMMRAIRFASQLDFQVFPDTLTSIQKNADRINIISQERITDELNKIIMSNKPSVGFKLLHDVDLLNYILPELIELKGTETVDNISHKDNFYHSLQVLDNIAEVSDNLWLRWTAILHDIGKPATKKFDSKVGWSFHGHEVVGARMLPGIFKRLKLPMNEKMRYVKKLVYLHLRPVALTKDEVTDSAVRRLIVEADTDIDDLLLLCKADVTSKNQKKVKTFLARFDNVKRKIEEVTEKDQLRNWKNPISGEVIMESLKLKPSRLVGEIKEEIKEAIMEGLISNTYEDAYEFMLRIAQKRNLLK